MIYCHWGKGNHYLNMLPFKIQLRALFCEQFKSRHPRRKYSKSTDTSGFIQCHEFIQMKKKKDTFSRISFSVKQAYETHPVLINKLILIRALINVSWFEFLVLKKDFEHLVLLRDLPLSTIVLLKNNQYTLFYIRTCKSGPEAQLFLI